MNEDSDTSTYGLTAHGLKCMGGYQAENCIITRKLYAEFGGDRMHKKHLTLHSHESCSGVGVIRELVDESHGLKRELRESWFKLTEDQARELIRELM